MSSGGVLTQPHDVRSLNMKGDKLTVQGTGITPRATSPAAGMDTASGGSGAFASSSRSSLTSDDDVSRSVDDEADSMLQGVVSMNQILEGQIEALRLRLHVEDKQHRDDKNKLRHEKDSVIKTKESEIEDLKDSLGNRDERIHTLVRASQEKDLTIQGKVSEIEELKNLVRQTEDYAHKLHKQIGQVKHKKQALETDTLYQEQNEEISRLNEEMQQLKQRLGDMEHELQRATKIMEQQSSRIRNLEAERGSMHATFKEELDKATKAMRQEVERMREVMRQNYEEMRQLRDQNRQMHSDVRDIKNLLMRQDPKSPSPRAFVGTGVQRPLTASPMNLLPAELNTRTPSPAKGYLRTLNQGGTLRTSRPDYAGPSASPKPGGGDTSSRAGSKTPLLPNRDQAGKSSVGPAPSGVKLGTETHKVSPAICGLKEGSALPSLSRQPTSLQSRGKSAARLSSGKPLRK